MLTFFPLCDTVDPNFSLQFDPGYLTNNKKEGLEYCTKT
jgi:hypothetical protein